jgi:hypothetical protein
MWQEIARWGWQLLATAAIAYAFISKTKRR